MYRQKIREKIYTVRKNGLRKASASSCAYAGYATE